MPTNEQKIAKIEATIAHGESLLGKGQGYLHQAVRSNGPYGAVFSSASTREKVEAQLKNLRKKLAKLEDTTANKGGRRQTRRATTRRRHRHRHTARHY